MFRSLACLSLIVFVIVIGSGSASAQVQITLGPSVGQGAGLITFIKAAGPQLNVQLGICPGASCIFSAPANSYLSINGIPNTGFGSYSLTTSFTGNTALPFLTQSIAGSGQFNYNPNGQTTSFFISFPPSLFAGDLTLALTFLSVTGGTFSDATFHGNYVVNIVTGGLGQFFPQNAVNQFDFTVRTGRTLQDLFDNGANGDQTSGNITGGSIHTPEPASIALFGSGLLLLGRVLRRRKNSAPAVDA